MWTLIDLDRCDQLVAKRLFTSEGYRVQAAWKYRRLKVKCPHHVVQSLVHAVISGIDQVQFGSLHGHGAASCDLRRHLQGSGHQGLLICKHPAAGKHFTESSSDFDSVKTAEKYKNYVFL